MPRTPNRPRRPRHEGALFLTDVVVDNVRRRRQDAGLSQREVAERMTVLGHPWTQATASELERETGQRALTIDELGALALVVGATVPELVDFGENRKDRLDYGHPEVAMKPRAAVSWLRGYSRVSITSVDDDGTIHWKIAPATRPGDGEEAR